MRFDDYIHTTNQTKDSGELFQVLLTELEGLGFDRVVYSYMTDAPQLNKKATHGVIRNYPDDWMKYYAEKKYIEQDPVYRTAFTSRRPFAWRDLAEQKVLKPRQKKIMLEAKEAGLKDGVGLSIQTSLGGIIGVGIASSIGGVDLSKDALCSIYALVNQFHLCYSEFEETAPVSAELCPSLSDREKKILVWCAQNKSASVIGDLLSISPKTVEFHLSNIYKKLQTNGRILAVLKALRLGLISP